MACKLDVDVTVQNLVQREVKNISKITNGVATVTQKFDKSDLDSIKRINDKVNEKMISYVRNDVTDLPGTVNITISDKLYNRYMIAIDKFRNSNNVNYKLSAVEILNTDKAIQVFAKGKKNGWDINETLTKLQIPKAQKQLILDKNITDREEIITSLLADNSFAVEIKIAKKTQTRNNSKDVEFEANNSLYKYYSDRNIYYQFKSVDDGGGKVEITKKEFDKIYNEVLPNTSYHSTLTVPGGSNYTENAIKTPNIINKSIAHINEFSNGIANMIGWFRSDEQQSKNRNKLTEMGKDALRDEGMSEYEISELEKVEKSGVRRILELQSDLFQKNRDKKDLIINDASLDTKLISENFDTVEEYEEYLESSSKNNNSNNNNQFLQLLNKEGNWVNFFVKSIVQDSVKKGYTKVLFPTGETAAKVQKHKTLMQELIKYDDLINNADKYYNKGNERLPGGYTAEINNDYILYSKTKEGFIKKAKEKRQELETESLEKNKPVEAFYTNKLTSVLNKLYKGRVQEITDEFGNTWNEVTTKLEDANQSFTLKLERQQSEKKEYKSFAFDKTKVSIAPANISEEETNKNKSDVLNQLFDGTFKPTTLNDFLRNLYSNPNINMNEEGLALMKALLPSRSKIKFVTSAVLTDEVFGRYDSLTRTILINKDIIGDSNLYYAIESILHEGTHDITAVALNQPKTDKQIAFRNSIQKAYDYYTKAVEYKDLKGDNYGFTDINEFASEIMTNTAFRSKLKAVESQESVWKQFINAIKQFLGLNIEKYDSIKVDQIINSIIDIASEEYTDNNQSSLNMTFEKRTSSKKETRTKEEIELNLIDNLTNVKSLITRIYATLEDVKIKSADAKGGKYKEKYREIQERLKELQDKSKEKAILEYLEFSVTELIGLEKGLENKENPDFNYLSRFKAYMAVFSNNDAIANVLINLKKYDKITQEDYNKIDKTLTFVVGKYKKVSKALDNKMRDALTEPLAIKFDRVNTEYQDQYKIDYRNEMPYGITKDEYVFNKMNENMEVIEAEKRSRIRKGLDIINMDISSLDLQLSSEKLIDHPLISILSEKIDTVEAKTRKASIIQRNKIAVRERKANFQGSSNKKRYDFMLDITKDNQYFITKYKGEFNDILENFQNKLSKLEYGEKEHKKVSKEKKDWIKANFKKGIPISKWLNPKYKSLTGVQKEYYDSYVQQLKENNKKTVGINSLFNQPIEKGPIFIKMGGITQSTSDKILSGQALNAIKTNVGDVFKSRKDEDTYGNVINEEEDTMYERTRTDLNNKPIHSIPVYYRNKLEAKDQSYDLGTMLAMDTMMSENYHNKKEIEAEADVLLHVISGSQVIKRNSTTKAFVAMFKKDGTISEEDLVKMPGKDSNLYKKVQSMIENRIYGISDVYAGKFMGVSINQVSNSIAGYTADLQLALNAMTAVPNVVQAKLQNMIEAAGADIFTLKDLVKAQGIYMKELPKILNDVGSTINTSKINILNELFDTMGDFNIIKNAFENKSKLRSLAHSGTMHSLNAMGEHEAQSTLMIAIMTATKVKNKDGKFINKNGKVVTKKEAMSLYEAYEMKTDKDGVSSVEINKHAEFSSHSSKPIREVGEIHHQQLIRKLIIKLHGQYDSKLQAHIERAWWGKLFMMFRKWMISSYKRRYAGVMHSTIESKDLTDEQKIYDYEMKRFDEGTYTSFIRFMRHSVFPAVSSFKLQLATENWKEMSDMERSNVRKTVTELMITGIMAAAAMLTYAAAEEDDDDLLFTLAYIFRRQQSEFMQFYDIRENLRVFRSPAVSLNTLEKTYSFMTQIMPWSIDEEYENGKNRGELKSWIKFKKLIPMIAQTERDPKELYNFLENSAK